jgi:hypothetical protein
MFSDSQGTPKKEGKTSKVDAVNSCLPFILDDSTNLSFFLHSFDRLLKNIVTCEILT